LPQVATANTHFIKIKEANVLPDFNHIYFITKFPSNSTIYFTEILPLEGECGQRALTELTMQMPLETKFL
jgi:hypothetical protein